MSSIVGLINTARTNPDRAATDVHSKLAKNYDNTELTAFNKRIDTFEGVAALDDMYDYMRRITPVRQLIESPALSRAAEAIAKEKGSKGQKTHEKPRLINQKVEAFGNLEGKVGELICFATNSPFETYSYFLVDDGLATRKRRRMLFDPQYKYIGTGSAPHYIYGTITVILLAQKVTQ